jgi:hypothetical protein
VVESDDVTISSADPATPATLVLDVNNNRVMTLEEAEAYTTGPTQAYDAAILIRGDRVTVTGLTIRVANTPKVIDAGGRAGCTITIGQNKGIAVEPASPNDPLPQNAYITRVDIRGFWAAVKLNGNLSIVRGNFLGQNDMMSTHAPPNGNRNDSDVGAMGVILHGNLNLIDYNWFFNNRACSPDYGHDGSSVEFYASPFEHPSALATWNSVRYNFSFDDHHFVEFGSGFPGLSAIDNQIVGNVYRSSVDGAVFLVTRGTGAGQFGRIGRTVVQGNTATVSRQPDRNPVSGADVGGIPLVCVGFCFTDGYNHLTTSTDVVLTEPCTLLDGNRMSYLQPSPGADRALYVDDWWNGRDPGRRANERSRDC